jgi:hypothetical protein
VRAAEEASDDAALAVTGDRALYAEMLLDFIQRGGRGASWQGMPMSRYGRADKRIHRILDGTVLSRGVTRWSLTTILALGLPLAYVVACAHPQSAPQAQAGPVQTEGKPSAVDALPVKPGVAGGQDRITGVIVRGNVRIPASTLRKSISIVPGDMYDPAKIERDVTALRNIGYEVREVMSDAPTGTKGGPIVIFYVSEKQHAAASPKAVPAHVTGSVPSIQAQDAGTPFVLQVEIYGYLNNPDGELAGQQTIARRSDGSTVLEDNAGPLKWGLIGRKVTFADGREISVIDALGIKTTWPSPTANELAFRKKAISQRPENCAGKNETLIGHTEIWDQNITVVKLPPVPMIGDLPLWLTEWRAPSLGCPALEYQLDQQQADGSLQRVTRSKVVSLTIGEPDAHYFAIPLHTQKPNLRTDFAWCTRGLGSTWTMLRSKPTRPAKTTHILETKVIDDRLAV